MVRPLAVNYGQFGSVVKVLPTEDKRSSFLSVPRGTPIDKRVSFKYNRSVSGTYTRMNGPMNRLDPERRAAILRALTEGGAVNATARVFGVSKNTVLKLLGDAGRFALRYQQETLRDLSCRRVQVDELWSFCAKRQKSVRPDEQGTGVGDVWTWLAVDADTKLVPCFHIGARDAEAARLFLEDLASRLANRIQLTTDGLRVYVDAVDSALGTDVDYAMLVKVYGPAPDSPGSRYATPDVVDARPTPIVGNPDVAHISASFVERLNLTMRMQVKRYARLTNAHSKKLENHIHAVSLHLFAYNFCRVHQTLTERNGGVHTTPAMAAGLTRHVWRMSDIVAHLPA